MRKHFEPEKVAAWTEEDLQKLVGKFVVVEVEASEWYKENVGGDWEGGSGICEEAGIRQAVDRNNKDIEIRFVHFDYGMGWAWRPDQTTHIHACDEHGDHNSKDDKKAEKCLRTLGVRGEAKGGNGGEARSSRSEP